MRKLCMVDLVRQPIEVDIAFKNIKHAACQNGYALLNPPAS
jgi:hypothetical protein